MRHIYITLFILFGSLGVVAQTNTSLIFNPHHTTIGSHYLPGRLGTDFNTFEITLPSVYGWVGNNGISYGLLNDFGTATEVTDAMIEDALSQLDDENIVGLGLEVPAFQIAFNVKALGARFASFYIGHREYVGANLVYGKNLFNLIYKGNKQFAGETINLGPTEVNALHYRAYTIGAAVPLSFELANISLFVSPGLRLNYLQGYNSIYTERGNISMFTEEDGRYLDFNFDYALHEAIIDSTQESFTKLGSGFSADIGAHGSINNIAFGFGLNNVGSIRFTENVDNYTRTGTYRYEGIVVDFFDDDSEDNGFEPDSLRAIFDPVESNRPFNVPLPTQLILYGNYQLGEIEKKNGLKYYRHNFQLAYIQGFKNYLNSSSKPLVGLGYTFSVGNILNLGVNSGIGGYNSFTLGSTISLSAGPIKFGAASNNLTALLAPDAGRGIDVHTALSLSF